MMWHRHAPCAMRLAQTLTMGHAFAERQRRGVTEAVAATAFEPFGQVIEAGGGAVPVADPTCSATAAATLAAQHR